MIDDITIGYHAGFGGFGSTYWVSVSCDILYIAGEINLMFLRSICLVQKGYFAVDTTRL